MRLQHQHCRGCITVLFKINSCLSSHINSLYILRIAHYKRFITLLPFFLVFTLKFFKPNDKLNAANISQDRQLKIQSIKPIKRYGR